MTELSHYGVKGMKWGVTKEHMVATTLSKAERKEARQKVTKFAVKAAESKYANGMDREMTKAEYDKLSTKTHVVKKGQEIGRITQRKDEKFSKDSRTYVSYTKDDRKIYRATMPVVNQLSKLGGNKKYKATYEATYKNFEALKSPSEKERVDAFTELFDSPSIKLKNGKTVTGREYIGKQYPREVKTLNSQQLGLKLYNSFAEGQFKESPINNAYFDRLKERGYNALVDDNDRVNMAEAPLIILNPNGSLKRMGVKPLTADDINNAQRELKVD
jgi:hypothetical protein